MVRFIQLAADAVAETFGTLVAWLGRVITGLDGKVIGLPGWAALAAPLALLLVMWAALALRSARRRGARLPQMMISHGEVRVVDEDGGVFSPTFQSSFAPGPEPSRYFLKLALSNLNPYPVQLLELAVRTRGSRLPVVADAGAVVPPNGAVDVSADLFDLAGDATELELYLYSGRHKKGTFRLVAPLEAEPWAKRYRVRALDGRSEPAPGLASEERRRSERRAFEASKRRERRRELLRAAQERAEGLKRQVDEYRVAKTERSLAAAEAAEAAVAKAMRESGVRRRPAVGPGDAQVSESPTPPPVPEAGDEGRSGLRFPDEF